MSTATALHNAITGIIHALEADDRVLTEADRGAVWNQGAELISLFASLAPAHEDEGDRLARRLNAVFA